MLCEVMCAFDAIFSNASYIVVALWLAGRNNVPKWKYLRPIHNVRPPDGILDRNTCLLMGIEGKLVIKLRIGPFVRWW